MTQARTVWYVTEILTLKDVSDIGYTEIENSNEIK